jgi:hypothetical protein
MEPILGDVVIATYEGDFDAETGMVMNGKGQIRLTAIVLTSVEQTQI